MDRELDAVASAQGQWSATADRLKATYEHARYAAFALTAGAALLAARATGLDGRWRTAFAMASAACTALVGVLAARLLNERRAQAWVRARAASEALKRESYLSATRAAPYDDATTRDGILHAEAQRILTGVDDLLDERLASGASSAPRDLIAPERYVDQRLLGQIAYHQAGADRARASAQRWRRVELILAAATAVLTVIFGLLDDTAVSTFDPVALTAVLTTVSGTVVAFAEASRYGYIATTFRATARRLADERDHAPTHPTVPSADWSAFVQRCEAILEQQNSSWVAKFTGAS